MFIGANELTLKDIEDFLNSETAATPAVESTEENPPATQPNSESEVSDSTTDESSKEDKPVENQTQAFAHRLKEATQKARNEERESIAKTMGYDSYEAMRKANESHMLEEKGLDPETVSPVVEQLVQKRLAEDPRLQELESYRQQRVKEWAQKELTELKDLTNGRISKLEDVPKEVLELWKTKGSLKAAYLELKGESLIREMRASIASEQSRGSTSHMTDGEGTPPKSTDGKRPYTAEEKRIYKLFNPGVSDEQLNKLTKSD